MELPKMLFAVFFCFKTNKNKSAIFYPLIFSLSLSLSLLSSLNSQISMMLTLWEYVIFYGSFVFIVEEVWSQKSCEHEKEYEDARKVVDHEFQLIFDFLIITYMPDDYSTEDIPVVRFPSRLILHENLLLGRFNMAAFTACFRLFHLGIILIFTRWHNWIVWRISY